MKLSKLQKLNPGKVGNNKIALEIKQYPQWDNKHWLKITIHNGHEWIVSIEELGTIIRAIGWCEDKKYPNGKGRLMLLDFLQDCLLNKTTIEELLIKYQVPVRQATH